MGEKSGMIVCCVVTVVLALVSFITLLVVLSYHGVEFYEIGFVRRKSTSEVLTVFVFQAGFYFIGIDFEFKVFKADAHIVDLDGVSVFTGDRLEVNLNCTMQYFLRPEDLEYLHDTYDLEYEDTLRNSAIDALKGVTSDFTTREFGEKRALVEEALFRAVRKRLGGTCCKIWCANLPEDVYKSFLREVNALWLYCKHLIPQVNLNCTMQYFLRPEDLEYLHDTYDLEYEDTLRNSAIDALKGVTSDFTTREFGEKRALVEEALFRAVRKRLGGTCCKIWCANLPEGCEPGCKMPVDCTAEDKGLYVDVQYFQLRFVEIPDIVLSRNLQTLTQLEDGIKETYLQQASLVRKTTEEIVTMVKNSAEEITQNATSFASLIGSQAQANARARVETSHNRGLAKIYSDLNITSQDHKASLNYIRMLRDHETVIMSVNFNSLVTGPINGGK